MPTGYGMPFDHEIVLRDASDGSLEAQETGAAVDLGGTPHDGLTMRMVIPSFTSANTTTISHALRLVVQASAYTTGFVPIAMSPPIAGEGDYMVRFGVWPPIWRYVRYVVDVAGTLDAGETVIGIIGHGTKFPDEEIGKLAAGLFEDGPAGEQV